MDKSGFRRFFFFCLFLSHSYQFVQIVSFLLHKHLKISIMLYLETYSELENLFTSMAG